MSYSSELKKNLKEMSMKKKCCRNSFFYGETLFLPERKRTQPFDYLKYGYESMDDVKAIKTEFFKCPSCRSSFLRGVFCACGTVSSPEKSFHFELKVKNEDLYNSLYEFISHSCLEMKKLKRNDTYSLYLKKGDDIEDIMHYMGAGREAFEVANEKIKRELANVANRRNNFEVVNLGKTVSAAGESVDAINKLIKKGILSKLPRGLAETAQIRLDNPFASLEELTELHTDRISKSGVNHRLKKLIELADEM